MSPTFERTDDTASQQGCNPDLGEMSLSGIGGQDENQQQGNLNNGRWLEEL